MISGYIKQSKYLKKQYTLREATAKMKTLVILGVFLAYAQATSEPETVQQVADQALNTCADEKDLGIFKKHAIEIIFKHSNILPVDNAAFTDFFACYWKKVKVIKDDGTFDDLLIKISYPHLIKDKYPNIAEADAQNIASNAVEHCKDTPTGDSIGLKGIQYRNCLTQYVIDSQA